MENSSQTTSPKCYVLIGPPASGKSTWRAANTPYATAISSDDYVEAEASRLGVTYAEAFPLVCQKAVKAGLRETFNEAVRNRHDIVIDRTNMTRKARNSFLASLPRDYVKVAVVFEIAPDIVKSRLDERARLTGKFIPDDVITSMRESYQPVVEGEFHQVINIQ